VCGLLLKEHAKDTYNSFSGLGERKLSIMRRFCPNCKSFAILENFGNYSGLLEKYTGCAALFRNSGYLQP